MVEEQEKTKSERRKKVAMFVEQLQQKMVEKIAIESDIIGVYACVYVCIYVYV